MTSTNRFLNRFFLAVVGLICLAIGAVLIADATPPGGPVRDAIERLRVLQADALARWTTGLAEPFDGASVPWIIAAACAAVVLLGLITIGIRGGGRTDTVVESDDTAGDIVVSARFAESALVAALDARRDLASVSATTFRAKGRPAIRLRLRLVAGASPKEAVAAASDAVRGLDAVLGGEPLPVLIEVTGASPARPGADSRVR